MKKLIFLLVLFTFYMCNNEKSKVNDFNQNDISYYYDTVYRQNGSVDVIFCNKINEEDSSLLYALRYNENHLILDSIFFNNNGFTYTFSFDISSGRLFKIKECIQGSKLVNRLFHIDSNNKIIKDEGKYVYIDKSVGKDFIINHYDKIALNETTELKVRLDNVNFYYEPINDSIKNSYIKLSNRNVLDIGMLKHHLRFYIELHYIKDNKNYHIPFAYYFNPLDSMSDIISPFWK